MGFHWNERSKWPNDLKLSDSGVRRGTCMVGGKAAVEAGAVTHGAVRCSAWLGVAVIATEQHRLILVLLGRRACLGQSNRHEVV